jgi:hypothetical protein
MIPSTETNTETESQPGPQETGEVSGPQNGTHIPMHVEAPDETSRAGTPTTPLAESHQATYTPSYSTPAATADRWLLLAALTVLAGISGVAYYVGFVRPYLLQTYYNKPLLDLAKIDGYTPRAANSWVFTWIVVFLCYYLAFRICPSFQNVSRSFRWIGLTVVVGWALLFCIQLVFMYPVGAADIFDQIFRARITHHYGLNPFTTPPGAILGDTFYPYVAWVSEGSPYGPLWELLTAGTGWLAGDSLWANLILFKVLVLVPYIVSVGLTYGILRALRPDWALRGTLFFAWNPLVIFEIAGNGHNDAFVVMFLLAAVYLFVLARNTAVLPALMAGALTKFIPILLVPVAAAAIWRDRVGRQRDAAGSRDNRRSYLLPLRALWVGTIVSVGVAVTLYAPFWEGPQSIGALGRQNLFTASIPKVFADWLSQTSWIKNGIHEIDFRRADVVAQATSEAIVRNCALGLVALVVLVFSLRIFFRRNAFSPGERLELVNRTLRAFYEIIFVYLAFATLWFQPWYLMWLIALTAPLASYTYAHRTLLFCIGGVLNYVVFDYIWRWLSVQYPRDIQITSVLVVYTLPLAYTLFVWLRPLWKRSSTLVTSEELGTAPTASYPFRGLESGVRSQ